MASSFKPFARIVEWKFNWKFWKPIDCIGGLVFIGSYAVCQHTDGRISYQTRNQALTKLSMNVLTEGPIEMEKGVSELVPSKKNSNSPSKISKLATLFRSYPKWRHLINKNPSYEEFLAAWEIIFEAPLSQCQVISAGGDEVNFGFEVKTPTKRISHGGFGYHTDNPKLGPDDEIFHSVGCPWSRDQDGIRYHKIDRKTKLPYHWEKVKAIETIIHFLLNDENKKKFIDTSKPKEIE